MTRRATPPPLLGALLLLSLACGGGGDQSPTPPEARESKVTAIEVTPDSAALNALEATRDFEASARDQDGNTMSGVSFDWSVAPDSLASVDESGTVTAEANGTATVEATASGVTGSGKVVVDQKAASLQVSPDSVRFDSVGDTARFDAAVEDANGHPVRHPGLAWSSSDTTVATVDTSGLATAVREGDAVVEASTDGISDTAKVVFPHPSGRLARSFASRGHDRGIPKPNIAASPSRVVVASTIGLTVHTKSGTQLDHEWPNIFFGEFEDARPGDPRLVYDPGSERFFYVAMECGVGGDCSGGAEDTPGRFMLAVSRGPNPSSTGSDDWHKFAIETPSGESAPDEVKPDAPRIGVSRNSVVLVGQMEPIDTEVDYYCFTRLLVLEKSELVSGSASYRERVDIGDSDTAECPGLSPAKVSRESDNHLFLNQQGGSCRLEIWALKDPLGSASVSRTEVPASDAVGDAACSSPDLPNAEQPDTERGLSTAWGRISQPVLRGSDLWAVRMVGLDTDEGERTGTQWLQIRTTGWPGTAETIHSGTVHREGYEFYPAVAATGGGDFAFVFGRSSEREHPSLYYRFSESTWPADSVSSPRLLRRGEASLTSGPTRAETGDRIRFGDWFGAAPDPVDDGVWLVGQYVLEPDTWGLWVGKVAF